MKGERLTREQRRSLLPGYVSKVVTQAGGGGGLAGK